jgi:YHS domain-containing protein
MNRPALGLALVVLAACASPSSAKPAAEISTLADGLAAEGYDVTAYSRKGTPARGNAAYQLRYKGAVWRFENGAALAQFQANPAAYEPQFGGYCAWAVSQNYIAHGDPLFWAIVDGKLYLNANARAKQLWDADRAGAIASGHANWPRVLTKNQDNP